MLLKGLGEERIIRDLEKRFAARHLRLIKGIGDDTSVTIQKAGMALLATTDVLIEGTHFKPDCTTPYLLGKKSLSISLSDIAAMGGEPFFSLVSLGLPSGTEKKFLDELFRGISDSAKRYKVIVAGGNTSRINGGVMVATTIVGEMPANEVVYRSGARPGDTIYVTGTIGDSALGLTELKKNGIQALSKGPFKRAASRHLDPAPRLLAGRSLAKKRIAHSMIDISDGLALDLDRVCEQSGVGAILDLASVPISAEMRRYSASSKKDWISLVLSGGEDYELLFTSSATGAKIAAVAKKTGTRITPVGRIVAKNGKGRLALMGLDGKTIKLRRLGFEHF
jgi:thiamine-monophosphate kinase